jgi:hypothetical protein
VDGDGDRESDGQLEEGNLYLCEASLEIDQRLYRT